jgi:hypothetical protein
MGEPELTSRELEVLRHLAGGNRNQDIGDLLRLRGDDQGTRQEHNGKAWGQRSN